MKAERGERTRGSMTLVAFAALAILAGPVQGLVGDSLGAAYHAQALAMGAAEAAVGAAALLAVCAVRRQRLPGLRAWGALAALAAVGWLGLPLSSPWVSEISWLHGTGWGVGLLIAVAAPLWVALLAAMQRIPEGVPRMAAGASLAGVAAVCLVVPAEDYAVTVRQFPTTALLVLQAVLMVGTWAFAKRRLVQENVLAVAAAYLLLNTVGSGFLSLLLERGAWQPVDWREAGLPLLCGAGVITASWVLWFWLLQRMTLGAFALRALAAWTAALLPGLAMFGILNWRIDAAIAIAFAAVAMGLRSGPDEEQPLALGIGMR